MKHVMFAIALIAGMLATGAAIEISEADILSGDIRRSPLIICRNSEADVYAETLTAVKPTVKSKGNSSTKVYFAAAAQQFSRFCWVFTVTTVWRTRHRGHFSSWRLAES